VSSNPIAYSIGSKTTKTGDALDGATPTPVYTIQCITYYV